ncbi:transglycosylase SLT domain-containing protein [Larsenimonas rhizosphaerae]|uniref:transglycosylase SLT domain-containing protein n=1 Tax=Larsenimonas rhizosphaerae TaxID=2944682 RepID=UPI0020342AA4|nr:transglycosylase SLT domain-containing protein [Larsenimonas rhizosphaerae]
MTFLTRLSAVCLTSALCLLALPEAQADDQAMRRALDAARHHQWSSINQQGIKGHALEGYIEYHRIKQQLPALAPDQTLAFINRYQDSPLSEWMRSVAIGAYGRAGRFQALRDISLATPPGGAERQCYFYRAWLTQKPDMAVEGARTLWNVGRSQDNACDPLFSTLLSDGRLSQQDIWHRLTLAKEAGNDSLANYLAGHLNSGWEPAITAYHQIDQSPDAIAHLSVARFSRPVAGALYTTAFHALTRKDTRKALALWQQLSPKAPLDSKQRHDIEHDLAFYTLVRGHTDNIAQVDRMLPQLSDSDLFELRVRVALEQRAWGQVSHWVQQMAPDQRDDARWQYWLARAQQQLGQPSQALEHYQKAAGQRSFFGFAAADHLGVPYSLEQDARDTPPASMNSIMALPAIQRINALERIGETGLARSEWSYLIDRSEPNDVYKLAHYALSRQWYELAVFTSIKTREWDALHWRFPPAHASEFGAWGQKRDVSPWLLMGIARRESAFNPRAQSPVGARGLMQLMPGTAAHVSRQKGIAYEGVDSLMTPSVNIALGSAYISDMLHRYSGNRVAAVAAYNAGPGRVDRWLMGGTQPFDLFVESIPFRETREYVQAVLAYQAIFESLAKGSTRDVVMLTPRERQVDYDRSMLVNR